MSADDILAEVERDFLDFSCEIVFKRKFDGKKFSAIFIGPFGTCGSVQTDEEKALDSATRLLKSHLISSMWRARRTYEPPAHWMAL